LISELFESTLHGQRIEAPRQAIHHIADLSKHPYATGPALNMLTQPTERYKLGPAIHLWAPVYLVLVARAFQVLVEPRECGERRVTQEALICDPVERQLCRPRNRRRGRLGAAQRPSKQAGGVGDVVICVGADNDAVELFARQAGRTGARLEMEYKSSVRDEGLVAAAAGAAHVGWLMHLRVEVVEEVGLALEGTLAVGAVRLHVANGYLAPCLPTE